MVFLIEQTNNKLLKRPARKNIYEDGFAAFTKTDQLFQRIWKYKHWADVPTPIHYFIISHGHRCALFGIYVFPFKMTLYN